jgi:hypothetical protein
VEPDETFQVDLTAPAKASIADGRGIGTITNDDAAPPAVPAVSVADTAVDPEGDSGTKPATFTVSLSVATTVTVTVDYATAPDSASAGIDYTTATGTLSFAAGQTSKTVAVAVIGDTAPEADEKFTLTASNPVNATLADAQGMATIVDDDEIGGPGSVPIGGLFCGTNHRGKCKGIPFKDEFDRPGNASWVFAAFNPPAGASGSRARASASKRVKLGTVKRKVRAGKVSLVFRLKPGPKAAKLYRKVVKAKLKGIQLTRTFTPSGGVPETRTKTIKLKR